MSYFVIMLGGRKGAVMAQ